MTDGNGIRAGTRWPLPNQAAGYIASVELEAVAALVVRWRRAGPPESPDAYAFAIAKRRAGRAVARHALMAPLDALRGVARNERGVEQSYQDRAELAIVLSAMRALSRADREALLLRLAGELPFDEIAA